jgi:hypothetical protein
VPRYVIERIFYADRLPTPTDSQHAKKVMAERFPSMVWEHSHIVEADDDGNVRTFCIYGADSADEVRAHAAELAPHDVLNIYELAADVAPDQIPLEGESAPASYQDLD